MITSMTTQTAINNKLNNRKQGEGKVAPLNIAISCDKIRTHFRWPVVTIVISAFSINIDNLKSLLMDTSSHGASEVKQC